MKKSFSTKRITLLAILTAIALIAFMIESLFPPLILPGAKLGLSNICTMICLVVLSPLDAFILVTVRTVLGSLFSLSVSSLIYSLTAGVISLVASSLMIKFMPKISLVAVSVTAAVIHNAAQTLVFVAVSGTTLMLGYLPYLALIGVMAGALVGVATCFLIKALPYSLIAHAVEEIENGNSSIGEKNGN